MVREGTFCLRVGCNQPCPELEKDEKWFPKGDSSTDPRSEGVEPKHVRRVCIHWVPMNTASFTF